jgi:hypothetical protein
MMKEGKLVMRFEVLVAVVVKFHVFYDTIPY